MTGNNVGMEDGLRPKMGRPARTQSVATRFTEAEELELLRAAEREGKTVREWTREKLLREARRPEHDPILTEVVAIRMFLNNAIKPLLLGETWTAEQFQQLTDAVRKNKRKASEEMMEQYTMPST